MLKRFMLPIYFFFIIGVLADDDSKDVGTVIGIDLGTTYSW